MNRKDHIPPPNEVKQQSTYRPQDQTDYFASDEHFHGLYPLPIAALAKRHWTPLEVSKRAADFLNTHEGARILDIGCGVGKFCLSAAHFSPGATFYGVEQRRQLLQYAENAKAALRLENVHFLHANFIKLDFQQFDHFYFFNSFYENLEGTDKIDDSIDYSNELFDYYNRILYNMLDRKPAGTRIVTYHSMEDEIPAGYCVLDSHSSNLLKCWVKI